MSHILIGWDSKQHIERSSELGHPSDFPIKCIGAQMTDVSVAKNFTQNAFQYWILCAYLDGRPDSIHVLMHFVSEPVAICYA
ncbi:hypothetical protein HW555_009115 [Spodoptera exigua]|uniref:Uncharacterized protein n=1 Tax=Spodoptera exigua TaxID=7107 RepID=A0A835GBT3_SPOEX|nr:hypothetical protein HW555_009115 [Spodoptera exigua]